MKGFAFTAVLIVLAVAILAQPILLEINTNFVSHKLQPQGAFISQIKVIVPKSIGNIRISKMSVALKSPIKQLVVFNTENIDAVPQKALATEIYRMKAALITTRMIRPFSFAEEIAVESNFRLVFPKVEAILQRPKFVLEKRKFKGLNVEDINLSKSIGVRVTWSRPKTMKTSLEILEMRKKVSAYSPLGGLETIGKYLEQNRYALWGNDEFIGMSMDTQAMSSWIAYNYRKSQMTNFSLSFNIGPFSPIFIMKEGDVSLNVRTLFGIAVGGTISSTAVSVFSSIPFTFGNLKAEVEGRYFIDSSPTLFYPKAIVGYTFNGVTPYVYYEQGGNVPTAGFGVTGERINFYTSMSLSSSPTFTTIGRYFGSFGTISGGVNWDNEYRVGRIEYSSVPFGFNPIQFSADAGVSIGSDGNYEVDAKLNTFFKFFFSYITMWIKGEFTGNKPVISYGAEASF